MNPLSIEEKLIFTRVKRAAIVWLLLLRMDPKPVNETLAAETLQIDKETARKYLRTLHELEIVTRLGRFDGYQLTNGGRQIPLPMELRTLAETNAGFPRSDGRQDISQETERGKSAFERGNPAFDPLLKEEEEELINNDINSSSSNEKINRILLENSEMLFGSSVVEWGIDLDQIDPALILGWLSSAYNNRSKLKSAASVVYRRLQNKETPPKKYFDNPEKYLSAEYLDAVGLSHMIPKCFDCDSYPCECPPVEIIERLDPEPNPRIFESWGSGSMTPDRAWNAAKDQLNLEMPRAAFETWIASVPLIDADPDLAEITIGVYNEYSRDWISSRLTSVITRLMTGILNKSVTLRIEIISPA